MSANEGELEGLSDDPSTARLVKKAREAAPEGFAALYARVAPALLTWARLRLMPELRIHLDPEDVVQEVCCRAFERFSTFDPERAVFRAWLFGIANNVLREALQSLRRRRGQERTALFDQSTLDALPDDATSVSRRVSRDENLRRFAIEIEGLPEDERRLLIYRGLEGLKHAEVAKLLGISLEAAEKRWQRIVKKLDSSPIAAGLLAPS
jgi:RNA polymerase sigma-70 factor, ECF subfamily